LPVNTKKSLVSTDREAESPAAGSSIDEDVELLNGTQSPSSTKCPATESPIYGEAELVDGAICEYKSLCPGIFDKDENDLAEDYDEIIVNLIPAQKRKRRRKGSSVFTKRKNENKAIYIPFSPSK